ncbi:MAG: hypothetical protein HQ559_06745 [Lentisphaerae bacterium]|nr:hypothetical protein [Lentisphaerota bacterium]
MNRHIGRKIWPFQCIYAPAGDTVRETASLDQMGLAGMMALVCVTSTASTAWATGECVKCHLKETPGIVRDWQLSKHAEEELRCNPISERSATRQPNSAGAMQKERRRPPKPGSQSSDGWGCDALDRVRLGWYLLRSLPIGA